MISILVKSFNRPFYLDRCLQSIEKFVSGDYRIAVLDDGTPEKYLSKIQSKHPNIEIKKSKNYSEKSEKVQKKAEINGFEIPTELWREAAETSEKHVLVTEDDVWFTGEVSLNEIVHQMEKHNIHLTKLGWLGNFSDDKWVEIHPIENHLEAIIPQKLFSSNEFVMDLFMYNKFKFFTLLYKLGVVNNHTKRKYWALNSILMGLYHKDYWLEIWKDAQGKVDEKQQLRNAAVWYHQHKNNKNLIARTKREFMKTTFQSSATSSYHQYGNDFDVNHFNHLMNEAWFEGKFDAMQNFPNDFSPDYFEQFFDEKIKKEEFHKWVSKFKQQYRNLGAQVD